MAIVDHHAPGSFCWFELATTDQSAAKDFYRSLFGWSSEDFPMGPGGTYTMFRLDGRDVGAVYALNPDQLAQDMPPNWRLYVAVQNADESARRAAELGGQIFFPPFDVAEHGRMAVLADPSGAVFSIWQPKQHQGVGVEGIVGTACWADLMTPNPGAAKEFYNQLFGWQMKAGEHDSSGYLHIINGQTAIGGIPPADQQNAQTPPHWLLYFWASDCAASEEKAKSLGASVLAPTMEIPHVGSIAVIRDPEGAVFAFYQSLPKGTP